MRLLRRFTDTGEWTTRRYLALAGNILIWLMVAIDAWYIWPTQLGGSTSMVVVSGTSMEPTYFTGDLVIARRMEPSIGDVIVYAPEGLGGSQIVHRIIGGNATDGWQMQGDNNDFIDPFTPSGDEVRGVVLVHYSNFGRVTVLLLNPIVWAGVLLLAIVLLLWWSDDCDDDDEDDAAPAAGEGDATEPEGVAGDADDAGENADADADSDAQAQPVHAAPVGMAIALARRSAPPRHSTGRVIAPSEPFATLRGRRFAAVAAAVVGAGLVAAPASASGLSISAPHNGAQVSYAACGDLSLAATSAGGYTGTTYSQASLSGVTAACAGLPTTFTMYGASGAVLATATGTSAVGTQTLSVGSYDASSVALVVAVIDGWPFAVRWTPPANGPAITCRPVNPGGNPVNGAGQSCTVTVNGISGWTSYPGEWGVGTPYYHYSFDFSVASSQNQWEITIDFSKTSMFPLSNATPVYVGTSYNIVNAPGYSCSSLPVYVGRKAAGNVGWGNSGVMYVTSAPGSTNGTTRLCP